MTIDDTLARLAASAAHPGLDEVEAGVFARIAEDARAGRSMRKGMIAAIGTATLAGLAGAAIPTGHPDRGASMLVPTMLAPSTLLDSTP
ncbi:hypothetical protein [Sphingomonas sp.]|uniref:hypothetical protein n=1 Tax=Sphingomonas sp. TaxID=28214 RepID=UPI000DB4C827|nr:hypothetical protein [Sphingomonas sp.]PZU07994.1 MAG: hypothetical protein DI605_14070 [Sphingomonas sp.]